VSEVVRAAGGVVTRRGSSGAPEVVVVHRIAYDDWTFPKGKADEGEHDEETAVREVVEETSLACRLVRELDTTRYIDPRGRPKQVRYWQMEPEAGELLASNEVDAARWLPLEEARGLLSYPRDAGLLDLLERHAGTVHLVRHAKAKNRAAWHEPDRLRPLTRTGREQAERIAATHARSDPARLVSSPATRCVQTLEPLAEATGVEIERADALAEGSRGQDALDLLGTLVADGTVVACTHGDVLLDALVGLRAAQVELDGPLESRKGSTWVLDVDPAGVRSAEYVEPPELGSRG